jgi:hypothetical protein
LETGVSLRHSEIPTPSPYREQNKSILPPPIIFPEHQFEYHSPSYAFLSAVPTKTLYIFPFFSFPNTHAHICKPSHTTWFHHPDRNNNSSHNRDNNIRHQSRDGRTDREIDNLIFMRKLCRNSIWNVTLSQFVPISSSHKPVRIIRLYLGKHVIRSMCTDCILIGFHKVQSSGSLVAFWTNIMPHAGTHTGR